MRLPRIFSTKVHRLGVFDRHHGRIVTAIALLFFAALSCLPRHADAADKIWNVSSGNWDIPGNWSPSGVPTAANNAYIDGSQTALVPTGISGTTAELYVGNSGTGTLNISGGTITITGYSAIGYNADSTGTATITSGTWSGDGLYVGIYGNGELNIAGGLVADFDGYIATLPGSYGRVTVTSGTWSNYFGLSVGAGGNGIVNISGGLVASKFGFSILGRDTNSSGLAIIDGGAWNTLESLYVGYSGTGTLNLADNGTVTVANGNGTLNIGAHAGSTGTLNIGIGSTAGTLNAAVVNGGLGTATVNFNHTGSYTFAPQLTGNLALNKLGSGTTVLGGSNTYTGTTTISSGKLALGLNGSITNSTSVNIASGAVFDTTALASGTFVMLGSQTFKLTLDPTGTGSAGLLNASGLDITNGVVDFATLGTLDDPVYVIADYTSLEGEAFALVINLPNGYFIDYDYNNGTEIAVVPEPGSFVLMGLGAAGLTLLRRKADRK